MSFWSTCHRLELAIKYSVGAELLRDIKECLMELYHLYKKSSKKLCSFEDLINKLKDLVELEGNYTEDTETVPINACGTQRIALSNIEFFLVRMFSYSD